MFILFPLLTSYKAQAGLPQSNTSSFLMACYLVTGDFLSLSLPLSSLGHQLCCSLCFCLPLPPSHIVPLALKSLWLETQWRTLSPPSTCPHRLQLLSEIMLLFGITTSCASKFPRLMRCHVLSEGGIQKLGGNWVTMLLPEVSGPQQS